MNFKQTARRLLYIVVSLFGIGYELMRHADPRWPLLIGYVFIIAATVYSLQSAKLNKTEESGLS
jgi:hypothetical protein